MSVTTFDKVLQQIKALPIPEQQRLLCLLTEDNGTPARRLEQLVAAQGTRPLSFEEMLSNFWPEDESTDEFLATLKAWRGRE